MAILDTLFGTPQSTMLGGLLGNEQMDKLRQQALTSGLINTAIGYLAQPKNQRFGSALPYLARAVVAGQQGAQGVYDDALRSWQIQQKVDEFNREKAARQQFETAAKDLYKTVPAQYQEMVTSGGYAPQQETIMEGQVAPNFGLTKLPDVTERVMTSPERQVFNEQALQQMMLSGDPRANTYLTGLKTLRSLTKEDQPDSPFAKINPKEFTRDSLIKFQNSGIYADLDPVDKAEKMPVSYQEYERAKQDPQFRAFLNEKWLANFYAMQPYRQTEQQLQQQEYQYKYGSPESSMQPPRQISVTTGGKTYYFPSQEAANAFKKQAGIK